MNNKTYRVAVTDVTVVFYVAAKSEEAAEKHVRNNLQSTDKSLFIEDGATWEIEEDVIPEHIDYRLMMAEFAIGMIQNALHAIVYADYWLSVLDDYVQYEIPVHLEHHDVAIDEGYNHLVKCWGPGVRFSGYDQGRVVAILHKELLAEQGLLEENDDD